MLARLARERLAIHWMDAALLSSLHGRCVEMLGELVREPGGSAPFLGPLAQSIAARRNEAELSRALREVAEATPDTQAAVIGALAAGRKNAPRKPLRDDGDVLVVEGGLEERLPARVAGRPQLLNQRLQRHVARPVAQAQRERLGGLVGVGHGQVLR